MVIKFPKKAPLHLKKRVDKAVKKIETGTARFRKTERYGYQTLSLGNYERLVKMGNILHVFNQHSEYEKFINRTHSPC